MTTEAMGLPWVVLTKKYGGYWIVPDADRLSPVAELTPGHGDEAHLIVRAVNASPVVQELVEAVRDTLRTGNLVELGRALARYEEVVGDG